MAKPNILAMALKGFKPAPVSEAEPDTEDPAEGEEGAEPMEDPRSQSATGDTMYLDKDLFPGKCKVGEKVMITGTIESLGTKYGVVPEGITSAEETGEGQE